jgi:aminoglycoside/choline kinase family phosphotransferase
MNTKKLDEIICEFKKYSENEPDRISHLPESGSNRSYYRIICNNQPVIGVKNADLRENKAFIYLAKHLKHNGVNVPEVLYYNEDKGIYFQEDLGDITLFKYVESLKKESASEDKITREYQRIIEQMPKIQIDAAKKLDYAHCYPREAFDQQSIKWDLNYFKYYFLKLTHIPFDEQLLELDYQKFSGLLLEADRQFFLYRDFQSRNILRHNKQYYFIDFQGGRKGALAYDLASLLFEAKSNLSEDLRHRLLDYYIRTFSGYKEFRKDNFTHSYYLYVLLRILQALGAYGYRGYFERKSFFLKSIPPALHNLTWLLENNVIPKEITYLSSVLKNLVRTNLFPDDGNKTTGLTVQIISFSYRKGIPADSSEHGGGFVFDCRSLPNPGRLEEFKNCTGLDSNVIQFLEEKPEVTNFKYHIREILDQAITNYMERNFNRLLICFGCTGGQHRSVYLAEQTKAYLLKKHKVHVKITHREQEAR